MDSDLGELEVEFERIEEEEDDDYEDEAMALHKNFEGFARETLRRDRLPRKSASAAVFFFSHSLSLTFYTLDGTVELRRVPCFSLFFFNFFFNSTKNLFLFNTKIIIIIIIIIKLTFFLNIIILS